MVEVVLLLCVSSAEPASYTTVRQASLELGKL